jgi:hypothetical protein
MLSLTRQHLQRRAHHRHLPRAYRPQSHHPPQGAAVRGPRHSCATHESERGQCVSRASAAHTMPAWRIDNATQNVVVTRELKKQRGRHAREEATLPSCTGRDMYEYVACQDPHPPAHTPTTPAREGECFALSPTSRKCNPLTTIFECLQKCDWWQVGSGGGCGSHLAARINTTTSRIAEDGAIPSARLVITLTR